MEVFPMADLKSSGMITITFDDALVCQFDNGYPLLRQHGVKGVMYVTTGLVGQWYEGQRCMSLSQLHELADAGWEIGSHTVSHPKLASGERTKLPVTALEAELRESRDWLLANGFSVISFAYPYGSYNDEVAKIARSYYRYARTCDRGLNEVSSANTKLKRFNLCHRNLSQWKSAVDSAALLNKWLIAMIHSVTESESEIPSGKEGLYISKTQLAECVQYAQCSGLPVRTVQEVYDLYADLPESVETTAVPSQQPAAGVDIKVEFNGPMAGVTVRDERRGFKLKFQHNSTEKRAILSEISKRTAFDLALSVAEIEKLARFEIRGGNTAVGGFA